MQWQLSPWCSSREQFSCAKPSTQTPKKTHWSLERRAIVDSHQLTLFIVLNGRPFGIPPPSIVFVLESDGQLAQGLIVLGMRPLDLFNHCIGVYKAALPTLKRRVSVKVVKKLIARRIVEVSVQRAVSYPFRKRYRLDITYTRS